MTSLQEYLMENLIQEKYGSGIIAKYMNVAFRKQQFGYRGGYLLQWDKIKDSNLREITLDEAMKLYRKQKESHYIIWVMAKGYRHKEEIGLITWSTDIVAYMYSIKGMTTKGCINGHNWSHIYDVEGYEGLMQTDIRELRRNQKEGATAIMNAEDILKQNQERYKKILAKLRMGTDNDVAKIFTDTMTEYQNTVNNWMVKYRDIIMTPHASTYEITEKYRKLTAKVEQFIDKIGSWNYRKNTDWDAVYAKSCYDEIKKYSNEIAEMCTKLVTEQN